MCRRDIYYERSFVQVKYVRSVSDKPGNSETKRDIASARRRTHILDAAMMCFIENGYHQTGVRDIAKRAGVSLGNLYNHFSGKHDVLVEIAALEREDQEPFLEMLGQAKPAADVLDAFVTAYATYLAEPEDVVLTIEITSEAIRKPDIGELFLANREQLVAALSAVIARGIADGNFRQSADPDETAHLVIELVEGSAYRAVLSEVSMPSIVGGLKQFIMAGLRR